jgi:drug/metabolite transporter (DMT)-like permease
VKTLNQSKVDAEYLQSGTLLVIGAALLFAAKGTLIKYIYTQGAGVADVMILRLLFSMPIYLWVGYRYFPSSIRHYRSSQWLVVLLCGICGYYVSSYFDMLGLQTVSAGLERIILYTYPAFVVLLSTWLFRKPVSLSICVCIAVIYGGLLLVFYADVRMQPTASLAAVGQGSLYVLISAMTFAGYVIGSEHAMRTFSSSLFTAVAMVAAGCAMAVHYVLFNSPAHLLQLSCSVYGWCAVTAIVFTVLPSFMMSAGVRNIGSAKAGALGMVGPVATVLIAASILGETISALQIVGLIVVVSGVYRLHKIR